jgi:hypothetical protein
MRSKHLEYISRIGIQSDNNRKIMNCTVYSINKQTEKNYQCTNIYICGDHPKLNLRGNSRGNFHASQEDYPDQVHSVQMVLGVVRRGGWIALQWPNEAQERPSGSTYLI